MSLALACWAVAMLAGVSWARMYARLAIAATALAFLVTQASTLSAWSGWFRLGILVLTPWLLAAQRQREEQALRALHAEEARGAAHLSEAARSLLAIEAATRSTEAQVTEITDVYHVTKETSRALHVDELFTASLTIAPQLLRARGLRLIDLTGAGPRIWRAARAADGRMERHGDEGAAAFEQAILTRIQADGSPAIATAAELGTPADGLTRVAWAPLWREKQAIGVLVADDLPAPQLKTLAIVANQLALQLSRVLLYQQVEALAVTDALTGVFVRSHFVERAREELARSRRHQLACTLMMVDLDHFKQKNDTFGHLVGDVVLRDVAQLLQRNLREIDMIARYGGEEFLLLLVETPPEQAMPIALRLKQLVEVHPIRAYDELLSITISVGVAGYPEHADTLEALIERADQALYAAKHAGRNHAVLWSPQHAASA